MSQEGVIKELNESLEQTNESFNKAQQELVAWAQSKFKELDQKNRILASALRDARAQVKNFSFNVQVGYIPSRIGS